MSETKKEVVSGTVKPETKEKLQKLAEEDYRSLSSLTGKVLEEYVAQQETQEQKE